MKQGLVRNGILALGLMGCLLFFVAFLASVVNPGFVEGVAKDLIRYQVEKTVHEKIDALDAGFLGRKAGVYAKGYAEEIALAKRQLSEQLPARMAAVIAEMRNLDCECRKKIESGLRGRLEWRIAIASMVQEHLTTLIRTRYMETAGHLTNEFRIFTATNAFVFALLAAAVLLKRQAGWHLVPVAVVLVAAAAINAYLYLFNQNWLRTIVFSDYVGFTYLAYLTAVFACLSDIIFNRARVTSWVMNGICKVAGTASAIVPC